MKIELQGKAFLQLIMNMQRTYESSEKENKKTNKRKNMQD